MALWVAATRFVSFDPRIADTDEALYLLMGQAWTQGHPPYTEIWDVKPPLLFAIFALIRLVFVPGFEAARAATSIAVFIAAAALYRLVRRHFEGFWTAVAAAALYPAYSAVLFGLNTSPELLLAPLTILAMDLVLLLWTNKARQPEAICVGIGLLFGAAILIKQSAVFELALALGTVFLLAIRTKAGRPRWSWPVIVIGTATAPSFLFVAYSMAAGMPAYLYMTPFVAPFFRLSGDGISFVGGMLRFLPMLKPILPLFAASLLLGAERRLLYIARDARAIGFVGLWLGASAGAILVLRSMYLHYYLTLLAPMCVLSALWLRTLSRKLPHYGWLWAGALEIAVCAYPLLWFPLAELPAERPAAIATETVAAMRAAGYREGDVVYVVNQDPAIYLLSGARPATRYAFTQHLMCDFHLPDTDANSEIRRIMESRPRFVVTSHWGRWMICERADRLALVARYLARDYECQASVAAGGESTNIYRRKGEGSSRPATTCGDHFTGPG